MILQPRVHRRLFFRHQAVMNSDSQRTCFNYPEQREPKERAWCAQKVQITKADQSAREGSAGSEKAQRQGSLSSTTSWLFPSLFLS